MPIVFDNSSCFSFITYLFVCPSFQQLCKPSLSSPKCQEGVRFRLFKNETTMKFEIRLIFSCLGKCRINDDCP